MKIVRNWRTSFCLLLLLEMARPNLVHGQVNSWVNTQSGTWNWEDGANWALGVPPAVNQSATFLTNGASCSPPCTHSKTVTIDSTTVANAPGSMLISNLTLSAPGSAHNILFLNNTGPVTSMHILHQFTIGSQCTVSITNSIMMIDGNGAPIVNDAFSVDGTVVFVDGGTALVTGGEAVGVISQGTLTVTDNGGNMADKLDIGLNSGSTGVVWVIDGNLVLPLVDGNHAIFIGNGGVGFLTQSNGAVNTAFEDVGYISEGTLTVAGGAHVVENSLAVGVSIGPLGTAATGTVWVTGGQLQASGIALGVSGVGSLTQSNGDVQTVADYVGSQSQGTLTVAGGIHVVGYDGLFIAGVNGSSTPGRGTGTVWLTGGQLVVTNTSAFGTLSGSFVGYSGTGRMTVSNGIWQASSVFVAATDGSEGTLTIAGGVSTVSSLVIGDCASNASGAVFVESGDLFVTNATHDAVLDVRNGFIALTAGQLVVDKLVMTNDCGFFFHGGGKLVYSQVELDPNLSAVADGIPNGWKLQYGLDPFDANLANEDPDGDGVNNLYEYLLGTNPIDPHDPFRITALATESNTFVVTWQYIPPPYGTFSNCIVETSAAVTGTWNSASGTITLPAGPLAIVSTNYLDIGGATNQPARYYRVRLVP